MGVIEDRLLEEIVLGIYSVLAIVTAVLFVLTQYVFVSAVAAAWVVFALVWIVGGVAVLAALVVLAVNAKRAIDGHEPDTVAILLGLAIPVSLVVSIYLVLTTTRIRLVILSGGFGLIVAPAGLVVAVYEERFRSV